jgi:ubiquitin fusion degradation protein 1
MIFKLVSTVNNKTTYVGVLEFIAEEGTIILPNWIFENLGLNGYDGGQIMVSLVNNLPKVILNLYHYHRRK